MAAGTVLPGVRQFSLLTGVAGSAVSEARLRWCWVTGRRGVVGSSTLGEYVPPPSIAGHSNSCRGVRLGRLSISNVCC